MWLVCAMLVTGFNRDKVVIISVYDVSRTNYTGELRRLLVIVNRNCYKITARQMSAVRKAGLTMLPSGVLEISFAKII